MSPFRNFLTTERRSTPELTAWYAELEKTDDLPTRLLELLPEVDASSEPNLTSLLWHHAQQKPLSDADLGRLIALAPKLKHWTARLTVCQTLAHQTCPPEQRADAFAFLNTSFADKRIGLRAWAVAALYRFREDPAYTETFRTWRAKAEASADPVMQARLRELF